MRKRELVKILEKENFVSLEQLASKLQFLLEPFEKILKLSIKNLHLFILIVQKLEVIT